MKCASIEAVKLPSNLSQYFANRFCWATTAQSTTMPASVVISARGFATASTAVGTTFRVSWIAKAPAALLPARPLALDTSRSLPKLVMISAGMAAKFSAPPIAFSTSMAWSIESHWASWGWLG